MVDFIHNNKDLYGVDAICRILGGVLKSMLTLNEAIIDVKEG